MAQQNLKLSVVSPAYCGEWSTRDFRGCFLHTHLLTHESFFKNQPPCYLISEILISLRANQPRIFNVPTSDLQTRSPECTRGTNAPSVDHMFSVFFFLLFCCCCLKNVQALIIFNTIVQPGLNDIVQSEVLFYCSFLQTTVPSWNPTHSTLM